MASLRFVEGGLLFFSISIALGLIQSKVHHELQTRIPSRTAYLTLLAVILSLLAICFTNPIGDFPLNDDWQYAYPVKTWIQDGNMDFQGVFAPNILLQIAWGFLFCKIAGGFDFTWLRFSTLALAILAVLSCYQLVKNANNGCRTSAGFSALVLAFNPLFYSLSFSFMSDVPFLAICILSIFSFSRYLEKEQGKWLFFAVCWAIGSFYIRQPGILLLPAFAIFLLFKSRFSKFYIQLAALLLGLSAATYFSLEHWVKPVLEIDDNYVPVGRKYYEALFQHPLLTTLEWIKKLIKTYIYLGLFGIPFLPFLWKKIHSLKLLTPKFWVLSLTLNALLLVYLVKIGKTFPFGGNVLYNFGLGPELLADVYTLEISNTPKLPEWAMLAINFAGQLSSTLLIVLIIRGFSTFSKFHRQFIWFLILLNAMYLPLMSITSFFDRYLLLPLMALFFALSPFLQAGDLRRVSFRWIPFLVIAMFSVVGTRDYLSWNRAKHDAFEYLISKEISIGQMDAGYEYNGFYNYHSERKTAEGRSFWWVTDDEWMITFGPVPGYEQVEKFPFYRWLFLKKDEILVLKRK